MFWFCVAESVNNPGKERMVAAGHSERNTTVNGNWPCVPALSPISCRNLDSWFHVSGLQFPHRLNFTGRDDP